MRFFARAAGRMHKEQELGGMVATAANTRAAFGSEPRTGGGGHAGPILSSPPTPSNDHDFFFLRFLGE